MTKEAITPSEQEWALATEFCGGEAEANEWDRKRTADFLAAYRAELDATFAKERASNEERTKALEQKMVEVFASKSPKHFGLDDNDYGRGYMAAVAAMADETTDRYQDVALRITDRRLRIEEVAFVALRTSRSGKPLCRVLRISDEGISEAGEGQTLDVAIANLKSAPKPDLL